METELVEQTAQDYLDQCTAAINANPTMHRNTVDQWRYVCRNVGAGLDQWDHKEVSDAVKSFYGKAIVRCCILAGAPVPINNKQVVFWLLEAYEEQLDKLR